MAMIELNTEFADAQAVTSTAISANVTDLFTLTKGAAAAAQLIPGSRVDIGNGLNDLWLVVTTNTACTDVGSDATLTVTLESADDAGLTTNAQVHATSGTLAFASFSAQGTRVLYARLPSGLYRRYLGLRFTVAAGPLTAGAFDGYLTTTPDIQRYNKSGFTVQ